MKTVFKLRLTRQNTEELFDDLGICEQEMISGGLYKELALPALPHPSSPPPPQNPGEIYVAKGVKLGDFMAHLRSIGLLSLG